MVYKIGSQGEIVKEIQKKIGAKPDGDFGPKTEIAVKQWQASKGLVADGIVGSVTLLKMGIKSAFYSYSKDQIENAVKSKGYKWFESKDLHLNIVGVRNSDPGLKVTNIFDDKLTLSYLKYGNWVYKEWSATTDPGRKGVMEYGNPNGVARLVPGQYIDSYIIRLHQGKYEALGQNKPVKVFRDPDRNLTFDERKIQEGLFGINIHKAGRNSSLVENWSEGCQVFKRSSDFEEFMTIARQAKLSGYKFFTYTLIDSKDIV